jgi:hypothetical protein
MRAWLDTRCATRNRGHGLDPDISTPAAGGTTAVGLGDGDVGDGDAEVEGVGVDDGEGVGATGAGAGPGGTAPSGGTVDGAGLADDRGGRTAVPALSVVVVGSPGVGLDGALDSAPSGSVCDWSGSPAIGSGMGITGGRGPPARLTKIITRYAAISTPTPIPMRHNVRLRRPLASTKTGSAESSTCGFSRVGASASGTGPGVSPSEARKASLGPGSGGCGVSLMDSSVYPSGLAANAPGFTRARTVGGRFSGGRCLLRGPDSDHGRRGVEGSATGLPDGTYGGVQ